MKTILENFATCSILLFGSCGPLVAAEPEKCLSTALENILVTQKVRRLPSIYIQRRCEGLCFIEVEDILKAMSNLPGYDIEKANVFLMTSIDRWDYHAVIEYKGLIFDPQDQIRGRVIPQYPHDYFVNHKRSVGSQARVVPAKIYMEDMRDGKVPTGNPRYLYLHLHPEKMQMLEHVINRLNSTLSLDQK